MLAIDWTGGIEDAWDDLAGFVPKLIAALVVFVVGWFIARLLRKAIIRILHAIKFDDIVDRSGLGAPIERAGWKDSGKLLATLLYYGIMILVLQLTIDVFGQSAISEAFDGLLAFIPKVFIAAIIVVLTGVVANTIRNLMAPAMADKSAGELFTRAAFFGIWIIGGFAAFDQLGVAQNVVDTMFQTLTYGLGLVFVISFGVGGIQAARDRFWPAVYDTLTGKKDPTN